MFRRRFRLPYVAPRSSPPCWRTAKWYHQILQKVQNLIPHDCIPSCTVYTVLQQYAVTAGKCNWRHFGWSVRLVGFPQCYLTCRFLTNKIFYLIQGAGGVSE